jgi:hypothetical protein
VCILKSFGAICSELVIFWCYSLLYSIFKVLSRFGYTGGARLQCEVSGLDKIYTHIDDLTYAVLLFFFLRNGVFRASASIDAHSHFIKEV